MESIARGLIVYAFLLVIFRIAGKRTLAESTNFELVMLLIISETTQQAMVDGDHSLTNSVLLVITLVGTSLVFSILKSRFKAVERLLDGAPLVLVEDGKMLKDRMLHERIDEDDILEAGRQVQGIERIDQIKHAVLERSGQISIIPK